MSQFNDLDIKNWRDITLNTDSLWIIPERKKGGKHSNFYHGNFVPQIPNEFIQRYTRKGEWVFDPFLGSATTAIECEELGRNIVGVDIQIQLIERARDLISKAIRSFFLAGDSTSDFIKKQVQDILKNEGTNGFNLSILHPPYADIIQFSDQKEDLSNCKSIADFYIQFGKVLKNTFELTRKGGYMILVIGDKYQNGEWIPLGFGCMQKAIEIGFKLKSIVVKNMEGNRGKLGSGGIWRYRALSSDYFIFKHEYILIFKK